MDKTILVTLDESLCDRACSLIENALLDSMAIGPLMFRLSVQEPKKPAKFNSEDFHNHGFVVDSPEHQLIAAAIDYAQSKRGVDQEWGSYRGGYSDRLKGLGSNMQTNNHKPLLVVSFKGGFDPAHARAMNDSINRILADKGWYGIVIDKMDKAQVQAFGVDGSTIDTLSLDDVISLLEGVKRLREAAMEGECGSQH